MKSFFRRILEAALNRYDGAVFMPDRSWIPHVVQAPRYDVDKMTREEIARKSEYFEHNDGLYNALVDLFEMYTVGRGLPIQPATSDPVYNKAAKAVWATWCQFPDAISRQSFGTLQGQMARNWFVFGEVFVLKTWGKDRNGKKFRRVQLIESRLIETPKEQISNARFIDGVEVDENGRPIAYWMRVEGPDRNAAPDWRRLDANDVVHIFEPRRPGELRGIPFVYSVINELHSLSDLEQYEQKAARDHASVTRWITNETGEAKKPAGLRRQIFTQGTQTAQGITSTDQTRYYEEQIGGKVVYAKNGDKMELLASQRPSVAVQQYWEFLQHKICSGIGVSLTPLVFPNYCTQGTALRLSLDIANTWFKCRSLVIQDALREIYIYVMEWEKANNPALKNAPDDWYAISISNPRGCNVDVGRNSAATIAELKAGATDYELIYGPQGLDWRERFEAKKSQVEFAKALVGDTEPISWRDICDPTSSAKPEAEPAETEDDSTEDDGEDMPPKVQPKEQDE